MKFITNKPNDFLLAVRTAVSIILYDLVFCCVSFVCLTAYIIITENGSFLTSFEGFSIGNMLDFLLSNSSYRYLILLTFALSFVIVFMNEMLLCLIKKRTDFLICIPVYAMIDYFIFQQYDTMVYYWCNGYITRLSSDVCIKIVFLLFLLIVPECKGWVLTQNQISRTVMKQIRHAPFLYESWFCLIIPCFILRPDFLYSSGGRRITILLPINQIITVFSVAFVAVCLIISLTKYRKIRHYYKNALENFHSKTIVVLREIQVDDPAAFSIAPYEISDSFFKLLLTTDRFTEWMERENILFLPEQLLPDRQKKHIMIDAIYDADEKEKQNKTLVRKYKNKSNVIKKQLLTSQGTLNALYCQNKTVVSLFGDEYDASACGIDELMAMVLYLKDLLEYRYVETNTVSKIITDPEKSAGCIAAELQFYPDYLKKNINQFLVFDYSIKWLEIINYFYSLTAVMLYHIRLDESMMSKIRYGDFNRWRQLRIEIIQSNRQPHESQAGTFFDKIYNQSLVPEEICESVGTIWFAIAHRMLDCPQLTMDELFGVLIKVRDYTRGHGVFTFDITVEINLALIKTVTYLICYLMDNSDVYRSLDEAYGTGWILYENNSPYFLYSYSQDSEELTYNSFRNGTVINVPINFSQSEGKTDENDV